MTQYTEGWLACREEAAKVRKFRARVDARGAWRIGRVKIERKSGDNPAELKALAMLIEKAMNSSLPPPSEQADQRPHLSDIEHPLQHAYPDSPTPSAEAEQLADELSKDLSETLLYHKAPSHHTATFPIDYWQQIIAALRKGSAT